jgi:hypothetical protein
MNYQLHVAKILSSRINEKLLANLSLIISLSLFLFVVNFWLIYVSIGSIVVLEILPLLCTKNKTLCKYCSLKLVRIALEVDIKHTALFAAFIAVLVALVDYKWVTTPMPIYLITRIAFIYLVWSIWNIFFGGKSKIDDYVKLEQVLSQGYMIVGDRINLSQFDLECAAEAASFFLHPNTLCDPSNKSKKLIILRNPSDSTLIEVILTSDKRTIELAAKHREDAIYNNQGMLNQIMADDSMDF